MPAGPPIATRILRLDTSGIPQYAAMPDGGKNRLKMSAKKPVPIWDRPVWVL